VITYAIERKVDPDEARGLWVAAGFTDGMPQYERDNFSAMLSNSNLVVVARDGDRMVGLSRALTDFVTICHVADLLVDADYRGRGIGRELVARTHAAAGETTRLVLLANGKADGFYRRIGLRRIPNAWGRPD
jgi:ribosomal protein S18 acetylase RimI-like enzyme